MKKNIGISLVLAFTLVVFLLNVSVLNAQTAGNLSFGVNLTSHNGSYGLEHVSAIWIENVSRTFVKTKYRMASGHTLNSHLPVWKAKSGLNVVDATAGATLYSYSAISINWNATNVSATLVPDGVYRVYVEFTWGEGTNHDTTSIVFTKGPSAVHLTPPNKTNFTAMSLDWVPSNVGIEDNTSNTLFSIYPNPVNSQSVIKYSVSELSDVTISMFDINGKLVSVLFDGNQPAGDYTLPLSVNGKLNPGIYFVKLYTGKSQQVQRILISE